MAEITRAAVRLFSKHEGDVFTGEWNPKRDLLVTGSKDGTARVWQLDDSNDRKKTDAHFENNCLALKHGNLDVPPEVVSKSVTSVNWDRSGERLATSCADGMARIWNNNSDKVITQLKAHLHEFGVKWNPSGELLLTYGFDQRVKLWDPIKTNEVVQKFEHHYGAVLDADWISNDTFATSSADNNVIVARYGIEIPVRACIGHRGHVNSVRYCDQHERLATGANDRTVMIWDIREEKPVQFYDFHELGIHSVRWSPCGNRIVRYVIFGDASYDHMAIVWDAAVGECLRYLNCHSDQVYSAEWSPDGRRVVTGSLDGGVYIWDIASGFVIQRYKNPDTYSGVLKVDWNHNGEKITACYSNGQVLVLDVRHIQGEPHDDLL